MKKIFIILITTILIFGCSLPVFASLNVVSQISEPQIYDGSAAFVIYNSNGSVGRLYYFYASGFDPKRDSFLINWYVNPDGVWQYNGSYTKNFDNGTSAELQYIVFQYDLLDGHFYYSYHRDGLTAYNTVFNINDYPYYINYGCNLVTSYSGNDQSVLPSVGNISWAQDIDYSSDFQGITLLLSSLYNRVDLSYQDIDAILLNLNDYFTWFKSSYYNSITNNWQITNHDLDTIIIYFETLLHQDQSHRPLPSQDGFNDDVDSYIDQEHQYIGNFDSEIDNIGSSFDSAVGNLNSFTNAFAFIGDVFNSFIPAGSLPYIFVFMSLTFGIVVLILGKQRG